ncbi:unnamed protein product [Cylicocyclus nassatus]|uniref:Uncharacterized protein n=1 Tax=Cylicocyclus nassatus TaxID=53992 RepID=A0AA36DPI3_CYLNA|nr:unnamed protein product [Cylicocyclus nassatus]
MKLTKTLPVSPILALKSIAATSKCPSYTMVSVWVLYGLMLTAFIFFVSYNVYVEQNAMTLDQRKFPGAPNVHAINAVNLSTIRNVEDHTIGSYEQQKIQQKGDVFDECPFDPPDPWHDSILEYVEVKWGFEPACAVNGASEPVLKFVNKTLKLLPGKEGFKCIARCLTYRSDNAYNAGRWMQVEDQSFECDFVETECRLERLKNHFVHMQISEQISSSKSSKVKRPDNPDVHIIVIDSVASTQIIRALPRTVNFLLHGMGAVEFRKLNKIGLNTKPNEFPLLLGITIEAVERTVMKLNTTKEDLNEDVACNMYLDNLPYVPSEYKEAGYKTLDAQDYVASVINYENCYGMKNEAVHHYYRPFHIRIQEDEELSENHEFPKFSFVSLTELTHDDSAKLYKTDYDLYKYFLFNRKALSNSFIFFMADHGPRFGNETKTSINWNEQKNPFLYIVLPKNLRNSLMHEQLKANSKELLTNHDIHSTLQDILYFQPATNFTELEYKDFKNEKRGSSLLRRFEAGVKRSCKTLPIPFQYCICQYETSAVTDQALRRKLAVFAADRLASLLSGKGVSSYCEDIKLGEIVKVNQYTASLKYESQVFDVTFRVALPAHGKFQIPVRMEHGKLALAGALFIRLDRYSDMGNCMTDRVLRSYCTCKDSVH